MKKKVDGEMAEFDAANYYKNRYTQSYDEEHDVWVVTFDSPIVRLVGEGMLFVSSKSKIKTITLPDSITQIDYYCFDGWNNLTSINIPDSVTRIDMYAFVGCENLTSITIPASVTYISNDAFSGCINMKNIYVAEGNANYMSIGNCLLQKEGNMLPLQVAVQLPVVRGVRS